MDTSLAGLPLQFWFQNRWYRINAAGIKDSKPYVQMEPANTELEAKFSKSLISRHDLGSIYSLDIVNKHQCFLADHADYNKWKAEQT